MIGFAKADDPLFFKLREHISDDYLLPSDLLDNAKTVVSFFLPFAESVIKSNRIQGNPSNEWLKAYAETNTLLSNISNTLIEVLKEEGIKATTIKPTHNFNQETLLSQWSHKHAAYIAGLGTFGLNHLLITKSGCGGRFGSVIIDAEIEPTNRPTEEFCLSKKGLTCTYCMDNCPVDALEKDGMDKALCYKNLKEFAVSFPELGKTDACGKCAVGPCGMRG